jgi:hypothetical protein
MNIERIDFISAYCDRWCERCAFTERCAVYACTVATAMCDGDVRAGIELAVGSPQPVSDHRDEAAVERFLEGYQEPSAEELAALAREAEALTGRVRATDISRLARTYLVDSHAWLETHAPTLGAADHVVLEAFQIVTWDSTLVSAKLHRALRGRERSTEAPFHDDCVRNDANGSAKVALISLERSEASWRLIADATGDGKAAELGAQAARLRDRVTEAFPASMAFIRPGFDEPWR